MRQPECWLDHIGRMAAAGHPGAAGVVVQIQGMRASPSFNGRWRGATRHGQIGWFTMVKEDFAVT